MAKAPVTITYASMVARDTVRITLLLTLLMVLDVKVGDVLNAYITAPVTEKIWTILGPKFGSTTGKCAMIVWSLHGLKSAGTTFCIHLAACMLKIGYTSCLADPDLWYKKMT